MTSGLVVVLVGIPIGVLLLLAAVTYVDAKSVGMDPKKWAAIAVLVPIFGSFLYLFERSERSYDPETDPYVGGGYNLHDSRADDERRV